MNEKTQPLAGIAIFAALSLVPIWCTDFEDMRFVGFGTRPALPPPSHAGLP